VFSWGNLRERDNFKDQDIDEGIILRWIFRKRDGGIYWIDLAQDRDKWQAVVNVVMNLTLFFPKCSILKQSTIFFRLTHL